MLSSLSGDNNRVMVTGASGFVGKALCSVLVERGMNVVAVVRQHGSSMPANTDSVAVGAINGATYWSVALKGVTTVIHLAARAHVMKDEAADPLAAFRETNVEGTLHLARAALAAGVRRFVFVSSIGVHGNQSDRPFRHDDLPNPVEPYARSKLEAERALNELLLESDMDLVIVRPPLVYGPDCPGNFRRLLQLVASGLPLPFASISSKRSFISVWNLSDFLRICACDPRANGQVFVVSDMEDVSLPNLLRGLAAGMNGKLRMIPVPVSMLFIFARLLGKALLFDKLCGELTVDATSTRDRLDWTPPVSLAEGLHRTGKCYGKAH